MKNASKVGLLSCCFILVAGCASESERPSQVDKPLVQREYRLQQDRKAFDEIRSQIPEDTQAENDELAFMEKLFENPLKDTSDIRAQFTKAVNKKREKFNDDLHKKREAYVKQERKDREQATKKFEEERSEFKLRKADREKSKEFYDELDQKRKDFYADQREKRDEFESQMRDDRKNFEDYMREKQSEFNARLKEFSDKQKQIKKSKDE